MEDEAIRVCNNPCSNYSEIQKKSYCNNRGIRIEVNRGMECMYDYKVLSKPTTHPFGEWGREPLPFP